MRISDWSSDVCSSDLQSHPQHELAASQQSGFGAVLGFDVIDSEGKAGSDEAWRFMNATEWLSITANLGDTKSTLTHPASTTPGRVAGAARAAADRNSVGQGKRRSVRAKPGGRR